MRSKIALIFLLLSINLFSQENQPQWVEFNKAKELFYSGNFKEALDYFLSVTESHLPFPEAEYMIGLVYLEEGELHLAEDQVRTAISMSSFLQVPEELIHYKYKLAEILLLKSDYASYENLLKEIAGGEVIDLKEIKDQKAYFDTLINSGIDRLLHLYRKEANNNINATIELGYYYNSIGEYKKSVNYLLSPVISLITEVIEDSKLQNREYVFTGMANFLEEVGKNKRALTYYRDNDFYKILYYLGQSLYGLEKQDRAMEIWTLMAKSSIDSRWVEKSKKQILEPTLENWNLIY